MTQSHWRNSVSLTDQVECLSWLLGHSNNLPSIMLFYPGSNPYFPSEVSAEAFAGQAGGGSRQRQAAVQAHVLRNGKAP